MKWKILREDEPGLFSPTGDDWDDGYSEGEVEWPVQSDFIQRKLLELQDADPERRSHSMTTEASHAVKIRETSKDNARGGAQPGVRKKDGDSPKSGT